MSCADFKTIVCIGILATCTVGCFTVPRYFDEDQKRTGIEACDQMSLGGSIASQRSMGRACDELVKLKRAQKHRPVSSAAAAPPQYGDAPPTPWVQLISYDDVMGVDVRRNAVRSASTDIHLGLRCDHRGWMVTVEPAAAMQSNSAVRVAAGAKTLVLEERATLYEPAGRVAYVVETEALEPLLTAPSWRVDFTSGEGSVAFDGESVSFEMASELDVLRAAHKAGRQLQCGRPRSGEPAAADPNRAAP